MLRTQRRSEDLPGLWAAVAGAVAGRVVGGEDSALMFKIYVGNLDYKVKVEQLRELFAVYAPLEDLVIPTDPKTNRAKGFAIVMIRDSELGQAAVKAMQGKRLMGRLLVVNEAVKRKKPGQPVLTKADLVRNGPFGPRMYRTGDPRGRTSRNPRRGIVGTGNAVSTATPTGAVPTPGPTPGPKLVPNLAPTRAPTGGVAGSTTAAASPVSGASTPSPPSTATRATAPARPAAASVAQRATAPARPVQSSGVPAGAPARSPAAVQSPGATTPAPPARPKAQRLATPKRTESSDVSKRGDGA